MLEKVKTMFKKSKALFEKNNYLGLWDRERLGNDYPLYSFVTLRGGQGAVVGQELWGNILLAAFI